MQITTLQNIKYSSLQSHKQVHPKPQFLFDLYLEASRQQRQTYLSSNMMLFWPFHNNMKALKSLGSYVFILGKKVWGQEGSIITKPDTHLARGIWSLHSAPVSPPTVNLVMSKLQCITATFILSTFAHFTGAARSYWISSVEIGQRCMYSAQPEQQTHQVALFAQVESLICPLSFLAVSGWAGPGNIDSINHSSVTVLNGGTTATLNTILAVNGTHRADCPDCGQEAGSCAL